MQRPTLYTLALTTKGKLSLMARPLGGEYLEEFIQDLKDLQVTILLSLLELSEQYELGLSKQAYYCEKYGIRSINLPIPDRGLPSTPKAVELVKQLQQQLDQGEHIVIHCRAGIGRTGIIAGAVLVASGVAPQTALQIISDTRKVQVPDTEEQAAWLLKLPLYFKLSIT